MEKHFLARIFNLRNFLIARIFILPALLFRAFILCVLFARIICAHYYYTVRGKSINIANNCVWGNIILLHIVFGIILSAKDCVIKITIQSAWYIVLPYYELLTDRRFINYFHKKF